MRVLVVHNRYSSRVPSGENLAVDDEVRWLREAGVDVIRHEVSNDDIVSPGPLARAVDGIEAVWSVSARRRFAAVLDQHHPDVVHIHNLFPLFTGSVPEAARRRRIPVVWTVHNQRVRCVAGTHFRDGHPCHDCRPGWRAPGVVHRCYAGSLAASALVTASTSLFRSNGRRHGVTALAISEHIARWLVESAGFHHDQVRVKYNGVAGPDRPPPPPAGRSTFLFLGRLSEDKGLPLLLDAWQRADVHGELRLVGDGDLRDEVRAAAARDPRITWVGQIPAHQIGEHVEAARAVVVPAIWEEPFGRTAAEALAHGRPVLTTGRGGLAEIVDPSTGWVTGTDAQALARAIGEAASDDTGVNRRGQAARHRWEQHFAPRATTTALLAAYQAAMGASPTSDADPGTTISG
jgi:glycosyltransferase involved in cell wall biosynthesis